jgi:hypothetical protein
MSKNQTTCFTMYSMHRQFFHNPMYYMDDLAGDRGAHLSAEGGHRSHVSQAEDGGTLQNGEDRGSAVVPSKMEVQSPHGLLTGN